MKWIKIENGKARFPLWPKFDAWLDDPKNEGMLIIVLIVVCLGVWFWGITL